MTTSSSNQPDALSQYLVRSGFTPNSDNPAWLDHETTQQTVRVLHPPGETTQLYCLDLRSWCLYEATFSPGTPDAVLTAAIEAALNPPPARQRRTRQPTGQRRTREGRR